MGWRNRSNLEWLGALRGVSAGHPLARHTSFHIGGPADYFAEARDPAELGAFADATQAREIPLRVLGAGTNLLISDAGVEGLVVRAVDREFRREGERVYGAAGLKMMRLARLAADQDLVGLEFAIGIPGTVGGAVYQDAGCWGTEVREVLVEIEGHEPGGGPRAWQPAELELGYRTSAFRDGGLRGQLITGAWFALRAGDGAAARRQMAAWTEERQRTQPIKSKNCGSVFRNPPGDSAASLVEAAGLKGIGAGGAMISTRHSNFIENTGGATSEDVRRLIERVISEVRSRFGVTLEPEVEIIGR